MSHALASLLIILLPQQGYWFAGQEQIVELRWDAEATLPADAAVVWALALDQVVLASGRSPVTDPAEPVRLRLSVPEVRTRTTLALHLRRVAGEALLDRRSLPVHVFADDLLAPLAGRFKASSLLVWDEPAGLPALLEEAQVPHRAISGPEGLRFSRAKIVVAGAGQLHDHPHAQTAIENLARAGASVLLLRQDAPATLMGHPLVGPPADAGLTWQKDHPLLIDLSAKDLTTLTADADSLLALRVPATAPLSPVAAWLEDAALPAPHRHVLITEQPVGAGRVLFIQLPLGDWQRDPRHQLLLRNALLYLHEPAAQP